MVLWIKGDNVLLTNYFLIPYSDPHKCIYRITVFKIFIWVGISWGIRSEILFYSDLLAEPKNMISEYISDKIPPQMKILNMVIPILMHFCSFVSNWCVASCIKLHVIQRNVA